MKKQLLLLLVLLISFKGFSQEDDEAYSDVAYGVRGAFNLSGLRFGESPKIFRNKARKGFAFGFFAEYPVSDRFLFVPELQFSAEGAHEEKLRLDYINTPLLFKYKIGDYFRISGGPIASLRVNKYSDKYPKTSSYSIKTLNEDDFNYFAFSAMLGVEAIVYEPIFVDLRYHYGFTDMFADGYPLRATNSTIQLGVGIKF